MFSKHRMLAAAAMSSVMALTAPVVEAQGPHKVTQVVATASFAFLPVYVAEHMGYFREEGVDLQTMTSTSAQAATAAVAGGSAHYYLSTPVGGARGAAQGAPLVNCGMLMTQNPTNIVVSAAVAKRHNLTGDPNRLSMEDRVRLLRGLRLAAHTPGSSPDQTLRFIVRHFGLDHERDLEILPIAGTPILAALEQGRIDGFAFSSPLADTAVIRHGAYKLISLADGSFDALAGMPSISMVCSRQWVERDTEAAAATLRAIWRGMALMRQNPSAAREAARKAFPNLSDDIFNAAFEANLRAFPDTPRITPQQMERALDFHHRMGGTPISVDVRQTFTNAAVDRAEATLRR